MRDKIMKMGSQPDPEYEVSIEYTNEKEMKMHLNDKIDDQYQRIDNITGKPTSRSKQ